MKLSATHIFDGSKFISGREIHIQKGKILACGPGGNGGATMVAPGFIDSHLHLLNLGLALEGLRLKDCCGRAEFCQTIRAYAKNSSRSWLTGRGWDQNQMGFTPDKDLLDSICPDRPLVLTRVCGHVAIANSKALALAGIDENTEISGGVVAKDCNGQLTGILEENAATFIQGAVPTPDSATLYGALVRAIKYAYSYGITGVHSDDRQQIKDYQALWHLYTGVTQSYPIRAQLHYSLSSPDDLRDYARIIREIKNTEYVFKGSAKLFLDGSLGAGTAALNADYSDAPGNKGVLIYDDDTLAEFVAIAEEQGIQLAVHAIGDRAAEQFIRVLVQRRQGSYEGEIQHRLIHLQVTHPTQLAIAKALDLAIEIQPVFLQTDIKWVKSRLGTERLQNSYCWQTMARMGLFLTGGSDSPVEDINPWLGVATAVTRRDLEVSHGTVWNKDESLELERALALFTSSPAALAGWYNIGRIIPGVWADLAYYSNFNQEELADNHPDRVLVRGEIVYRR